MLIKFFHIITTHLGRTNAGGLGRKPRVFLRYSNFKAPTDLVVNFSLGGELLYIEL